MRTRAPLLIVVACTVALGLLAVGSKLVAPSPAAVNLSRHPGDVCYLMFEEGRFELGGPTGSYLVLGFGFGGTEVPLSWPSGVHPQADFLSTVLVNEQGELLARTGSRAHLGGGYGQDGTFLVCGWGIASFVIP